MALNYSLSRGEAPIAGTAMPLDMAPVLIIENPLPSYHQLSLSQLQLGSKSVPGVVFCPGRLKHVESIDAIFPDENQVSTFVLCTLILPCLSSGTHSLLFVVFWRHHHWGYYAASLDRPHYQIARPEYDECCSHLAGLSKKFRRVIHVNEFLPGTNLSGPNCRVVNCLSLEMTACFDSVNFEGLGEHVKQWSKCDPTRGNIHVDAGFASNLSSQRIKGEDCGVSKPAMLTPHPTGKEMFADAMV